MDLKRTATFVVVGASIAAWIAGAATSGTRTAGAPPIRALAPDPQVDALATQVSRLHERLTPAATPLQPGRDLFRFAAPKPKAVAAAPKPALVEAPAAVAATPPRPPLKLAGIAEDAKDAAPVVRTAIISTTGQLILAREGDPVTSRFRVTRITADVVELVDLVDNSTVRLALR